ncbi:MAG: DUF3256 family protein [Bacteroides sp.]|nr:DUF3256 family protein [Bacteroides sp.]
MRRLLSALMATLAVAPFSTLMAETTATGALRSAPSELLAPVSRRTVRDLIDYAHAGMMTHTEPNILGSEARIMALDSAMVELQTSPGRTLTIHLLPLKADTAFCVIETIAGDFTDSHLTVYSSDWTPQPKLWSEPQASAWGTVNGNEAPIIMAEYTFDPSTGILTLVNTSELRDQMIPALRYRWTAKGFKPVKK